MKLESVEKLLRIKKCVVRPPGWLRRRAELLRTLHLLHPILQFLPGPPHRDLVHRESAQESLQLRAVQIFGSGFARIPPLAASGRAITR